MSSIAQDELGHAAALYGLLGRADRRRTPTRIAYDREPDDYRHAPAARPRPRRLGDDDRPALPVRDRRRGPPRGARRRVSGRRSPTWSASSCARSATTGCTSAPGSSGSPAAAASRATPARGARDARPGRRDGVHAAPRRAGTGRGRDPRRADGRARASLAGGHRRRRCARSTCPMPPRDARPRAAAGPTTATPFRWLWGEFTAVRRCRSGSDLVSEGGTQVAVARARAGAVARADALRPRRLDDRAAVRAALAEVPDPELPMRLDRRPRDGQRRRRSPRGPPIRVELLPTFVGCPALELIRDADRGRGSPPSAARSRSTTTFATPWTIGPDQRRPGAPALARRRRSPPPADAGRDVRCPWCALGRASSWTARSGRRSAGSLYYCRDCRQPFEA